MAHTSVVFPRPPPTYNTLSQAQRAQLLRSSAKLGQILGSTPHILDDTEAPQISPPRRSSSLSEHSRSPSVASTASTSSTSSDSGHSERAWRASFSTRKPPLMRIGKVPSVPPSLDMIPGSPRVLRASGRISPQSSPGGSPQEPSFGIASDAALRRQKMRRLARRLGEGVPVHLVFPPNTESDEDEVLIDSPTSTCVPAALSSKDSMSSMSSEESGDRQADEREAMWERQTSRRSRFARASAVVSEQYVVHYCDEDGMHGRGGETFGILPCGKFAPIPEEEDGISCV